MRLLAYRFRYRMPPPLPPVLVAEDDPDDLFFFKRTLEKAQIANPVIAFSDGEEAVAYLTCCADERVLAQPGGPCVLFLDNKMPRMSGLEVLTWVRTKPAFRTLKVMMLSAAAEPSDSARATEFGADGYLIKYPTPEVIRSIVREAEAAGELRPQS